MDGMVGPVEAGYKPCKREYTDSIVRFTSVEYIRSSGNEGSDERKGEDVFVM